jgi:hypothetical protein
MDEQRGKDTRRGRPAKGTLELRKSGWFARLTVTLDGERVRKFFDLETHDRSVAVRKLARLAKQAEQHTLNVHQLTTESKRVETYAEAAERIRAIRRLEGKRSVSDEESHDRLYFNPIIGHLAVTEVRPRHIRQALEVARETGKSGKTLTNLRASASGVFEELWRSEVIPENPVKRAPVVKAKNDRRERAVLTDEELALYLAWTHPDERFHVFVEQRQTMSLVSRVLGGARTGDLHALTWQSFDLTDFAFGWMPRSKTERPQRMHIEPVLRPYLRRWWERMGSPADGLVFPRLIGAGAGENAKPGSSYAEELRRDLKRAMGLEVFEPTRYGGRWVERVKSEDYSPRQRELFLECDYTRPVDFHSWRRAFNQALADAGMNAQQAAALAGHATLEAHQKYLRNTAKAATLPAAAVPKLVGFLPVPSDDIPTNLLVSSRNNGGGAGSRISPVGFQAATSHNISSSESPWKGMLPAEWQKDGDIPEPIPAPRATLADVLRAADRAIVDGDVYAARRLLAEALARCAERDSESGTGAVRGG